MAYARFGFPTLLIAVDAVRSALLKAADATISRVYRTPVFASRCKQFGRRFTVHGLPHVIGHTRICVGEGVTIHKRCGIISGRVFDDPTLILGDGVVIGDHVGFSVNKLVTIGAGTYVGPGCHFADNDGHPRDPESRVSGAPPPPEDILPITIGRNVRIGAGTYVMKGTSIGDRAVIANRSVVLTDVPAGAFYGGNPAMPLTAARKA